MSSMINEQKQNRIKKIIKLQKVINNINIANINKAKEFIIANDFLNSKDGLLEIVNNLIISTNIRPLSISLLANLARDLISIEGELLTTILKRVFEPIPENYNVMFSKSIEFKFLRRCMDKKAISYELIKSELKTFRENYPDHKLFLLTFFCWFSPEMDSKTFDEFYSLMNEQIVMKNCPRFLIDFAKDFPKLRRNNWRLFKERVKYGHFMNTIPYCIKYDQVDTLSKYAISNKFNYDQFITSSIYEPSSILREGAPLIHFAAFYGSIRCFKFLLLNGSNIHLPTDSNRKLPQYAVAGGNDEIIRICDQKQLDFSKILHVSALFHRNDVFNWIRDSTNFMVDGVDHILGTSLHQAVVGYNVKLIYKLVVNDGIDPNIPDFKNRTPLHFAVLNNCECAIKFLLNIDGVDPNVMDSAGNSPFHYACKQCKKEIISDFITCQKVDINLLGKNNVSPLHLLAKFDNFDALPMLLQVPNLRINCFDEKGRSPLHYAVISKNIKAIKLLCTKKWFKINGIDKNGMTPLHLAVINGEINVINALLSSSSEIDVNAKNYCNETPLHCAVGQSFMDPCDLVRKYVVKRLLDVKGIRIDIINKDGHTPLTLAQKNKFYDIVEQIQLSA